MSDFGTIAVALALALVVIVALYAAHQLTSVGGPVSTGSFLSGMAPTEHALSRFHVRWYTVTVLFLAFDVEMLFMYPWAVVVASMGAGAVVEMFVFLGVLMAGVVYAWREGALRWS